MRKLFLFAGFLLCQALLPLHAQQHLADSIKRVLDSTLPDTARALNMVFYAMYMETVDAAKSHELYADAVKFSEAKNLPRYAGMALRYEATPYHLAYDKPKERSNLFRAIGYLEKATTPAGKKELGNVYGDLGSYYRNADQYDSAAYWFLRALPLLEASGTELTNTYCNLAGLYQQLKLPEKQREYSSKALEAAKKSNKKKSLYVGYLYNVHYFVEVKEFNKAKLYLDSARPYFAPNYDFSTTSLIYLLSGITYQQLKLPDSAIFYYNKAYEHAKQRGVPWSMVEPKLQIGHIYYEQKKYPAAEAVTREAIALAEKDSIQLFMEEGYGLLTKIFEETGRHKEANEYIWKYVDIKDSIEAAERKTFALDLEKKYETEKKDHELLQQQTTIRQQHNLNYILIGGAAALLVITLLTYRNYRNKQKLQQQRINELETEKQLTATEAVLKGEEQERTRLAKDLHDGLGGMLSGIKHSFSNMKGNLVMTPDNQQAFERSMDMLDSSIREMRRVAHNMMPEVLVKYGLDTALKDYCIEINKSGALPVNYQSIGMEGSSIDQTKSITLYRIAQELLNNAIKHAGATQVIVQVTRSNGLLSLTVEDDGKGFNESVLQHTGGIGWHNIRNRVEFLKGRLDVNSAPGKGSSVLVEVEV
ncbi:sensor histidine kinase [Paraflavitalea sp. CAU 1676]|uniref:tetratricopeptide repeat-containing sensor histidine kinase n=1 Tax=Paraflavitalea sp. CAU 1676 TaxID=3032598 RepID=UPI0023DB7D94|nr:sensor histidine kinase [Paraflavitalea sp. CAU 1676]MDF2187824.1 sensor histidine kinase [Paraflavitalea sp. CAU 1676]